MGDSFSCGFELSQDEFLGGLLEKRLGVRVLNSEIFDPAHALYWFEQYGAALKARVVLLGICGNDPMQTEEFCGPTRRFVFGPDGKLALNAAYVPANPLAESVALVYSRRATPASASLPRQQESALRRFEHAFALDRLLSPPNRSFPSLMFSYVLRDEERDGRKRLIDGTANLAYFANQPIPKVTETFDRLFEVLTALNRDVKASGAKLAIVLFPQKFQVHPEEWTLMKQFWNLDDTDFDLDLSDRRIREFSSREGIECIELAPALAKAASRGSLYFPLGDVHLNVPGHAIAAEAVAERLRPLLAK
jgi:hypothetical protein